MSEERFDRLEGSVAKIETDVAGLRTDVGILKTDVAVLKTDVAGLKTEVAAGFDDLGRQMRVLHEDLVDKFKALPDYSLFATKADVQQGDAAVREEIGRRLDPLEVAVRQHSTEIERLKEART